MPKKPHHPTHIAVVAPVSDPVFDAFAIASPGCAPLVADELRALDVRLGDVSSAGVAFTATTGVLLRVNLWSRLASRILVRLAEFTARDFATLEKQAARVPWKTVVAPGASVRFRVTCRKSRLYHSDAVAERLARAVLKAVPSATIQAGATRDDDDEASASATDTGFTQLIVVRFEHDRCTISADTSGELLHRRGWRQAIAKAPLRETLAAAMLVACDWTGDVPLVDPFCGSGTIGIEAALRARDMAPGLSRGFAIERWPGVDAGLMASLRDEARARIRPSVGVPIVMSDRDAGACDAARANAARAGVTDDVQIMQQALSSVDIATLGSHGLVLSNPPYGLRISEGADLRSLYARLGDVIRAGGIGWRLGLLIPDRRLAAPARLPFASVLQTSNGGIGVRLEIASRNTE